MWNLPCLVTVCDSSSYDYFPYILGICTSKIGNSLKDFENIYFDIKLRLYFPTTYKEIVKKFNII